MITIKPPIIPSKPKKYYMLCKNSECQAGMVVEEKEMRFVQDHRDGDFYQIDCPHCKRYITVYATHINLCIYEETRIRGNDR
jgi:hypothetical protein